MFSNNLFHKSILGMNTCLDIIICEKNESITFDISFEIESKLIAIEKMLSCFDTNAETYRINQTAFNNYVEVSDELWKIIIDCIQFNKSTLGYFDVALKKLKTNEKLIATEKRFGIDTIELNENKHSVRFQSKNTAFDFGGIGKGYLLQQIESVLDKYFVDNCLISFGGSSYLTRGKHPHGDYWPLSFREKSISMPLLKMNNHFASVSSSKTDTTNKYHIVNPANYATTKTNSFAIVQCNCPVVAEVLSTSLLLASETESKIIIANFNPIVAYIYSDSFQYPNFIEYRNSDMLEKNI